MCPQGNLTGTSGSLPVKNTVWQTLQAGLSSPPKSSGFGCTHRSSTSKSTLMVGVLDSSPPGGIFPIAFTFVEGRPRRPASMTLLFRSRVSVVVGANLKPAWLSRCCGAAGTTSSLPGSLGVTASANRRRRAGKSLESLLWFVPGVHLSREFLALSHSILAFLRWVTVLRKFMRPSFWLRMLVSSKVSLRTLDGVIFRSSGAPSLGKEFEARLLEFSFDIPRFLAVGKDQLAEDGYFYVVPDASHTASFRNSLSIVPTHPLSIFFRYHICPRDNIHCSLSFSLANSNPIVFKAVP